MSPELRNFRLTPEQSDALKGLYKKLGLRQIALAEYAFVSQSWVSNLFTGATPVRELKSVAGVVERIRQAMESASVNRQITSQLLTEGGALLDEILLSAGFDTRKPILWPLGILSPNAANYIPRSNEEAQILRILDNDRGSYSFTLGVTGPPDSGKSTLLAFLAKRAIVAGVKTTFIDFGAAFIGLDPIQAGIKPALSFMSRIIADDWNVVSPERDSLRDTFDFRLWLREVTGNQDLEDKRLLIINGGIKQSEEMTMWMTSLVRGIHADRASSGFPSYALAVELAPTPAGFEYLSEEGVQQVSVGWFSKEQVERLVEIVGGGRVGHSSRLLYEQYAGQPFLTHVAAMQLADNEGLQPIDVYNQALAGKAPFFGHDDKVRSYLSPVLDEGGLYFEQEVRKKGGSLSYLSLPTKKYLVRCGLFNRETQNGDSVFVPSSSFYTDLMLRMMQ